ncbi:hypothetical protein ABFS82_12G148100 [Erythranthe guttata]
MEMESTRRAFDRSMSKEPGLKKPRLIEDPTAQDRISNGRGGLVQRPTVSNSGIGAGSRVQSGDSMRGPYQHQVAPQLHQELVTQYKTALAELTFNSKPIITNLTIIAGESSHAAKAIAATICTNIIEVPSEQKLPSLYLLDSIVKNIGKDYIRYFASRLPEVFCKAYRQVEPAIHQGMRHLFGTWKGVFPPQTLQMIENELGFTTAANGSPSRTTSRQDSQAQRPAHSIHVNPKYLEARRLQTTRARDSVSDSGEALLTSHEDVEELERAASISSGRSWADPYAKPIQHHHRDQVNGPVRGKSSSVPYSDSEYGSSVLGRPGLETGRVVENLKERGYDRSWYESGSNVTGMSHQKNGFGLKRGFEGYAGHESANSNSDLQLNQKIVGRNTVEMSENWKNSEEEEYMWDEMNSRSTVRDAEDASKDHWGPDNHVQLVSFFKDFQSHLRRPQDVHDIGSRDDDEASADSISMDLGQLASGTQMPLWSRKLHSTESMMLSEGGKSVSVYSEAYPTVLKNSQTAVGRAHSQSHLSPSHIGGSSFKLSTNPVPVPKVAITQQGKLPGAAPSSKRSVIPQRPPSPSFPNQLLNNFAERNQTSVGPPTDPRRPLGQTSRQKLQPQSLRSSSTLIPSVQQRKNIPSAQKRNLEVSELDMPSQVSGSESRSTRGNSSSDQSNPLTVHSPSKSISSISLDAVVKSGIQGIGSKLLPTGSKKKVDHPSLPTGLPPLSLAGIGSEQTPSAVSSSSNPFSSLLSSLVAKGLISSSKSDSLMPASTMVPVDKVPAVATSSSSPVSSVPFTIPKPLVSITDIPSSSLEPAVKASNDLPQSTEKIKQLIGFEFKPDVVRNSHPDVISDLVSDLPHECSICGLRFKLQERLGRHMEWHASKFSDYNPNSNMSRKWYASVVDWVAGIGLLHLQGSPSDMLEASGEMLETCEQMVPADESQCACILCGELFEDFYSQERDEWMYKAAVYLTIPSSESDERIATSNDSAILGPIVHANCVSKDSIHDLGLVSDVKLENDV